MFGRRKKKNAPVQEQIETPVDNPVASQQPPAEESGVAEAQVAHTAPDSLDEDFDDIDLDDPLFATPFDKVGPWERADVEDMQTIAEKYNIGIFDLGALALAVPAGGQIQAELTQEGVPIFHVACDEARVTVQAFAAPKKAGVWRDRVSEVQALYEDTPAETSITDGPWGRELTAKDQGMTIRLVGVDGDRWFLQATAISTIADQDKARDFCRNVLNHCIIDRGPEPMAYMEPLPLQVPQEIVDSLVKAHQQQQQHDAAQAAHNSMAQNLPGSAPTDSAMNRLRGDSV